MIELSRSIVFLDVETTGRHPRIDRVVQVGLVKIRPDGATTEWSSLVNPGIPIPIEATACHGITDQCVVGEKRFIEVAPLLARGLRDCDLGGYNLKFDIMFLDAEFRRCGISDWRDGARVVDAFRIHSAMEPRTLTAAVKFYLGEDFDSAHSALDDARAAMRVFEAQATRYDELPRSVEELDRVYFSSPAEGHVDREGKIAWRHGEATINFGNKHLTKSLRRVAQTDPGYLRWILASEFSGEVKRVVELALRGEFEVKT